MTDLTRKASDIAPTKFKLATKEIIKATRKPTAASLYVAPDVCIVGRGRDTATR